MKLDLDIIAKVSRSYAQFFEAAKLEEDEKVVSLLIADFAVNERP